MMKKLFKNNFRELSVIIAILAMALIFGVLNPAYLRPVNLIDILDQATIYGLMGVGIMLPIRLKFDSEKSRYANLIMIAVVFIAAFLVSSAIDYLPVNIVEAGKEWLYGMSAAGILGLSAGITAVIAAVSYACSRHIMAKKEF